MLDALKLKNPDIKLYSVNSEEFKTFGRVITGLDTSEIIKAAEKISRPAEGSAYTPSEVSFERLPIAKEIENKFFGTLPAQIGYCHGHNSLLNAAEWHMSSEINIVKPLFSLPVAQILPPCISIILLQTDRPMPEPFETLLRALSAL